MNEKTSSFLISCEKGKEDEVKKMINKFKNPKEINQLSRSGETALHISIAKNYIEVAKILISSGIDINLPETTSGLTPLQYSCWFNKISFVNLLISEKAKLQIKDQRGWNCLHWASFSNNSEIIESLLDADSSLISVTNNAGNYPINIAITENRFQSFSTLIQKITPITQMNKKGFLPIHLLAKNSRVEMMKEIMKFKEKIDLNALSKAGKTALHYSVLSGNLEIVKILVQNDAKVNVVDENYLTPYVEAERNNFFEICNYLQKNSPQFPLHEMIKQGNIKKIRSFLKYKERETDKEKDKEKEMDFDDFDLEGNRPLHLSIQKGNIKIVKELLKKKNQINSIDRTKCSPLSLSINEGKVQIFNLLLQQNPDFSFQDLEGNTFLHTAILQNQDDIAKIILEKSLVDINPTNHQQITPLHLCSKTGNSVMIGELLKFGANPNLLDSENQTPLGIAIQNGHIQVIFMLLTSQTKIPVNLNIQDSKGRSFLMLAIKKHQIETAKLLIKKNSNINLNDKEGNNALHYAIEEEQAEILQNLIEKGIEVKPTADKIPPLHLCIKFNKNLGCFKTLLNSGLDVNLTDHKGNTTLHYAVMFSKPKFLSWIQLISTNIDAFNSNGWTALHLAAGNGQILSLKFLITKGAKIDCQNDQQKTPLHLASSNRHFECVKLLVNFGADLAIKDLHGKIPFDLANKDWHEKIAEYLLLKGSPSPLKEAILSTDEENVKKLISENYLMDIIDSEGNTYLHYALSSKNPKIFEIILEKTENPNVMNKKREYPLHLAVQWGDVAICKRLLQAGADLLLPHPEERPHILATKYNSPCKELVNKEFQRVSSILELVETERNYVFSIKDLLDIVIVPLMKTFSQNEDILPLLENVEQIVNANVSLLNQFELKIANWNYDVGIGDVMTDFAPTMTKYADFNLNYEMLKNTIKRKMSGNNPFANLSKTTSIGMSQEKLSLDSVLIKPVQRIAQYPLLLQEVLKSTPEDHPDYSSLQNALTLMKEYANNINETKRKYEDSFKIENIQKMISGTNINLSGSKSRKFRLEGVLYLIDFNQHIPQNIQNLNQQQIHQSQKRTNTHLPKNHMLTQSYYSQKTLLRSPTNHYHLSHSHDGVSLCSDSISDPQNWKQQSESNTTNNNNNQQQTTTNPIFVPEANIDPKFTQKLNQEKVDKQSIQKFYAKKLRKVHSIAIQNALVPELPILNPNTTFSPRYLFLFSDMLLVCKTSKQTFFQVQYRLSTMKIFLHPIVPLNNKGPIQYTFKMTTPQGTFVFGSESQKIIETWVRALAVAINDSVIDFLQNQKKRFDEDLQFTRESNRKSFVESPIMISVPDLKMNFDSDSDSSFIFKVRSKSKDVSFSEFDFQEIQEIQEIEKKKKDKKKKKKKKNQNQNQNQNQINPMMRKVPTTPSFPVFSEYEKSEFDFSDSDFEDITNSLPNLSQNSLGDPLWTCLFFYALLNESNPVVKKHKFLIQTKSKDSLERVVVKWIQQKYQTTVDLNFIRLLTTQLPPSSKFFFQI